MKIRPEGAESLHEAQDRTDTPRQTDIHTYVTKLTVAFRNFANAPTKWTKSLKVVGYASPLSIKAVMRDMTPCHYLLHP
jgi:hypothetical protein